MSVPHLCPRCKGEFGMIHGCLVCKGHGLVWEKNTEMPYHPYPVPYGIPYAVSNPYESWTVTTPQEEYRRRFPFAYL